MRTQSTSKSGFQPDGSYIHIDDAGVYGAASKVDIGALLKGESAGHPFRGNQYTGSKRGGATFKDPHNMAVGAGRQKAFAKQMLDAINSKDGGFTFTAFGSVQKTGYAVGEFPERSLSVGAGALKKQMVASWLDSNKDLLSTGKYHIGGWNDTGGDTKKYWLDIVSIYPNTKQGKRAAIASGRKHNQAGIMRLDDMQYFDTGGDGAAKADLAHMAKVAKSPKTVASRLFLFDNHATADEIFSALMGGTEL